MPSVEHSLHAQLCAKHFNALFQLILIFSPKVSIICPILQNQTLRLRGIKYSLSFKVSPLFSLRIEIKSDPPPQPGFQAPHHYTSFNDLIQQSSFVSNWHWLRRTCQSSGNFRRPITLSCLNKAFFSKLLRGKRNYTSTGIQIWITSIPFTVKLF